MKLYPGHIAPAFLVGLRDMAWFSPIIVFIVGFDDQVELIERIFLGLTFYAACSLLYACYLLAALAVKAQAGKLDLSAPRTWSERCALISDYVSVI